MSVEDSSSEPDSNPLLVVPSLVASDQQRPSIISLGEESQGLPGLLSPAAGNGHRGPLDAQPLQGRNISGGVSSSNTVSGQFTITEFVAEGFIISTEQTSDTEEIDGELNEATSEFVSGENRASSALSPHPGGPRRESNVAIRSTSPGELSVSSSSEDDSADTFNRRGHQGSYVLRKGNRRGRSPLLTAGDSETLEDRRRSSVMITPISSLNRTQQNLLDFGDSDSSEEEESNRAFGGRNHRSLVLRRANRQRASPQPPTDTVFTNPAAATGGEGEGGGGGGGEVEEVEPIGSEEADPEIGSHMTLDPGIRKRVNRSLHVLQEDSEEDKSQSCCDPQKCCPWLKATTEPPVSPELRRVQSLGFKMFPFFVFPALPKLLQDIWVAVELFVAFFEFVFACITFGSGGVVSTLVVVLSLVNLVLASVDSFLYFVEGGSCVSLFRWGRRKLNERRESEVKGKELSQEETDEQDEGTGNEKKEETSFGHFRAKARKVFGVGSEVIRASLTELLLYPLTILDIYELIDSQTYSFDGRDDRINFGLINIGLFYLVLTVYLLRILMAVSAIVSISRLPKSTNTNYHNLLVKFSLHIIGQIFVHMTIIAMVATKIDSEVCESVEDGSGSGSGEDITRESSVNVSPFLIVTVITGDVIPFLGVAMFFVVNYPVLKQFMMGFCIDMMSTIVSEDFASTAFSGTGIKNVNRKTSEVENKVNLASVRQQFNVYANVFSFKKKLSYRLTNPLVLVFSILYFSLVTLFLTCHALGWSDPCDSSSGAQLITFSNHPGVFVTFIIGVTAIALANYQVVLMSMIWLLALAGLTLFVATLPLTIFIMAPLIATVVMVKSCI